MYCKTGKLGIYLKILLKRIHPAIEKTRDKTYTPSGFKTFAAKIK